MHHGLSIRRTIWRCLSRSVPRTREVRFQATECQLNRRSSNLKGTAAMPAHKAEKKKTWHGSPRRFAKFLLRLLSNEVKMSVWFFHERKKGRVEKRQENSESTPDFVGGGHSRREQFLPMSSGCCLSLECQNESLLLLQKECLIFGKSQPPRRCCCFLHSSTPAGELKLPIEIWTHYLASKMPEFCPRRMENKRLFCLTDSLTANILKTFFLFNSWRCKVEGLKNYLATLVLIYVYR